MNTPTDPQLQKVLVRGQCHATPWGICGQYRGTQADLVAAGVAASYMFEDMGRSGVRTRRDEFGDRYIVRRQAQGVWSLTRFMSLIRRAQTSQRHAARIASGTAKPRCV